MTGRNEDAAPLHVDTDHGVYDVLAVRDADEGPARATHAVFHESGALAGFIAPGFAWDAGRGLLGYPVTLAGAAAEVADADVPTHGYDQHGAHSRQDTCGPVNPYDAWSETPGGWDAYTDDLAGE
jgi:hypothetical protein